MTELAWTAVAAVASWAGVITTAYFLKTQINGSKEDMRVRLQLTYEDRFDAPAMVAERKLLAEQLLTGQPHDAIQEAVIDFFESAGVMLRRGYLDKEMFWSSSSFYAIRWWSASKDYIAEERRLQNNDMTLFCEFEKLVNDVYAMEEKKRKLSRAQLEPGTEEIKRFLEAEKNLV